ncbi:MAG TPA: 6-phosphogluconolactonase [Verrucomicrobiae bacterium]|jgi:6-phosphogluconolactonase|nr:6-phosphogluconolactonase [Verrucomicrobiae bacterium]
MGHKLIPFANPAELAKGAATSWLMELRKRNQPAARYNVALSGGRITQTFFSEIVTLVGTATEAASLFQNVHFYWADERCVPPTDAESNFGAAQRLLFGPLKIPEAQIHRLRGEGPEPQVLREAIIDICAGAPSVKGQPVLDMIFLGMGEDGHVASLFPGETEDVINNGLVYRAVTAVKPPPRRITLGYAVLAAATEVWVVASGAGKEGALKESLSANGKTPLGRVLRSREDTKILTDIPQR